MGPFYLPYLTLLLLLLLGSVVRSRVEEKKTKPTTAKAHAETNEWHMSDTQLMKYLEGSVPLLPGHFLSHRNITLPLPLRKDQVQLFGFSTVINRQLCISLETAALSGWTYQLFGPTMNLTAEKAKASGVGVKSHKILILSALAEQLPATTTLIFADAFDTIFQRNSKDFLVEARKVIRGNSIVDVDSYLLYNAEKNCWPFRRWYRHLHCVEAQGREYVQQEAKRLATSRKQKSALYFNAGNNMTSWLSEATVSSIIKPRACLEQLATVPSDHQGTAFPYFNSGLSVGKASSYKLLSKSIFASMSRNVTRGCARLFQIGDQGIIADEFAKKRVPITLDYEFEVFGTTTWTRYIFSDSDNLWRVDTEEDATTDKGYKEAATTTVNNDQKKREKRKIIPNKPFMIHDVGGCKNCALFRDRLVQARFESGKNRASIQSSSTINADTKSYKAFITSAAVYVDGKKMTLDKVCSEFIPYLNTRERDLYYSNTSAFGKNFKL